MSWRSHKKYFKSKEYALLKIPEILTDFWKYFWEFLIWPAGKFSNWLFRQYQNLAIGGFNYKWKGRLWVQKCGINPGFQRRISLTGVKIAHLWRPPVCTKKGKNFIDKMRGDMLWYYACSRDGAFWMERCPSGWRNRSWKPAARKCPWVRIPLSPPNFKSGICGSTQVAEGAPLLRE